MDGVIAAGSSRSLDASQRDSTMPDGLASLHAAAQLMAPTCLRTTPSGTSSSGYDVVREHRRLPPIPALVPEQYQTDPSATTDYRFGQSTAPTERPSSTAATKTFALPGLTSRHGGPSSYTSQLSPSIWSAVGTPHSTETSVSACERRSFTDHTQTMVGAAYTGREAGSHGMPWDHFSTRRGSAQENGRSPAASSSFGGTPGRRVSIDRRSLDYAVAGRPTSSSIHSMYCGGQPLPSPQCGARLVLPPALTYALKIRQQPRAARACGFGERDRRVIDPPPIIELQTFSTETGEPEEDHGAMTALHCTLVHHEDGTDQSELEPPQSDRVPTRRLMGSLVAAASVVKDENGVVGSFYVFPDLSCRSPGPYRLHFRLMRIDPRLLTPGSTFPCVASCTSDIFTVYAAKDFPGMRASSALLKALRAQGVVVGVKKGSEQGSRRGGKQAERKSESSGDDDEWDDEDMDDGDDASDRKPHGVHDTGGLGGPSRQPGRPSKKRKGKK